MVPTGLRRIGKRSRSTIGEPLISTKVAAVFEDLYLHNAYSRLSFLNRALIEAVCRYLGVSTKISSSTDYTLVNGTTERLADLCAQAGGTEYISGPSAREYLEESVFARRGIALTWFDYSGYTEYPQLWGEFTHGVTILDLLFNCGRDAPRYMKYVSP